MSDGEAQQLPAVWVGEAERPRDEAARALAEWARARGVILSAPAPRGAGLAVDPKVADDVEKELAKAHDSQSNDDTAERALARAEALLRDHPELPNAAWLLAEVLRSRRQRTTDPVLAASLWQDAIALDGGRVPNIGQAGAPPPPAFPLKIDAPAGSEVRIDGHAATPTVLSGEHAVVALNGDRVVFASWLAVRGPMTLGIASHEDPCASIDAHREGDRVVAPTAMCPSWVAAVPGDRPNSVLVARCVQNACSSLVEWRTAGALSTGAPTSPDRRLSPWPGWATWTCAGIGAATVLAVVLVASGVFESRPVEQRFVVGGARTE